VPAVPRADAKHALKVAQATVLTTDVAVVIASGAHVVPASVVTNIVPTAAVALPAAKHEVGPVQEIPVIS
jgi:hypothetical protein